MWRDTASPPGPVGRKAWLEGPSLLGTTLASRLSGVQGPPQAALTRLHRKLEPPGGNPFTAWLFSFTQ